MLNLNKILNQILAKNTKYFASNNKDVPLAQ